MTETSKLGETDLRPPVRGALRLMVSTSTPKVTSGSDFSIFVTIQNPFDMPITVYQTQTHIPIDLIDINGMRIRLAQSKKSGTAPWYRRLGDALKDRMEARRVHTGIAIAVGTDFVPTAVEQFAEISQTIQHLESGASVVGLQFVFPQNPSADELDQIFRRIVDYQKGLVPVRLQPGDSVVKQFVLRTRRWLFFTPITQQFQIQINYSIDGIDHASTVTYEQAVHASFNAIVIGGAVGAVIGTLLKSLTSSDASTALSVAKPMLASILAAAAVVVAFARKAGAQPVVSVEDFWGGALIGFSTGFFGFERFLSLFGDGS